MKPYKKLISTFSMCLNLECRRYRTGLQHIYRTHAEAVQQATNVIEHNKPIGLCR